MKTKSEKNQRRLKNRWKSSEPIKLFRKKRRRKKEEARANIKRELNKLLRKKMKKMRKQGLG